MEEILSGYKVGSATWLYLSFFLIVAVYFRFNRIVTLRNSDLLALLAISPGILLAKLGSTSGYVWLFIVCGIWMLRLIFDGYFTRRPRLEQNLNTPGLTFLCAVAFVFLSFHAWTSEEVPASTVRTVEAADRLLKRQEAPPTAVPTHEGPADDAKAGPAAAVLTAPFAKLAPALAGAISTEPAPPAVYAARLASIIAHLLVIVALVCIGRWHFGDQQIGVAMGALYMLLPCTSYDVGRLNHVLPAALILWALAAYRRPLIAGALMALACGTLFFPVFLLPLWFLFYDRRGALRFGAGLAAAGAVLIGSLILTSADTTSFLQQMVGAVIDWRALSFRDSLSGGFWQPEITAYRIPVFVAFCAGAIVVSIWPRHKTLEHLIANSAAIIIGTQFWYPQQGGVYSLWYVPLLLVVIFRPTLSQLEPPRFERRATSERTAGTPATPELVGSAAPGARLR
jgi:Glycosyltransferase family 87